MPPSPTKMIYCPICRAPTKHRAYRRQVKHTLYAASLLLGLVSLCPVGGVFGQADLVMAKSGGSAVGVFSLLFVVFLLAVLSLPIVWAADVLIATTSQSRYYCCRCAGEGP